MISATDKAYQDTKCIKLGVSEIDTHLKSLVCWVSKKYNVTVLNIVESILSHNNKIRISVHLETQQDALKFYKYHDWCGNFDTSKLIKIAKKYLETRHLTQTPIVKTFGDTFKRFPTLSDIFVSFSAFMPIAKAEANNAIPEQHIDALYTKTSHPEIWKISRYFDRTTLFVFTDEQLYQFKNTTKYNPIEDAYFQLLKTYDTFDYWKREDFNLTIDSKQNFNTNFDGNWYHYYL